MGSYILIFGSQFVELSVENDAWPCLRGCITREGFEVSKAHSAPSLLCVVASQDVSIQLVP